MSKGDVLMWLSALGDPWLSGPLAIVLIGLIAWRLRRSIKDQVEKFLAWLGNRKNSRIAICVGLAPIGLIWFWLLVEAITEVWVLTSGVPQEGTGKEIADANRNRVQAIFFGVGLIGALLAAIIVPVRLWFQYRQTTTAEQGHITDRLTKAIEQLGTEKTRKFRVRSYEYDLPAGDRWDRIEKNQRAGEDLDIPPDAENVQFSEWQTSDETVPNLEVRLGAIYALERIAQDSERDHITVMETLCAYIRENAPASEAKDHDFGEWPEYPEDASPEDRTARRRKLNERERELRDWSGALPSPRVDIQAALTAIGRRSDERIEFERRQERLFQLDLRNTNLRKTDLTHANLDNALLTHARMEGANLREARMKRAHLNVARMEGAHLNGARMERAHLNGARMEGANLWMSRMEGANLWMSRMQRAHLNGARMEGARFHSADLRSVALSETFADTSVREADLRSEYVTQETLNNLFGDAATKIPDGLNRPDHWDDETLPPLIDDPKFSAWLESRQKAMRTSGG